MADKGTLYIISAPSGAGKTSVFNLLLRFYDPAHGQVRIDGVDLRQIRPEAVRTRFGLVPQDPVIFAADGWHNIRFGRPDADDRAVRAAARAAGADCILLIIAILEPENYADLFTISTSMGMDVLVEVFDESELESAMQIDPRVIGVNNRNLKTLKTSLTEFEELAVKIPPDRIRVAESGMKTAADVERMGHAGANAVLVGESLMKAGGDLGALVAAMAAVEVG